jgi:membrane associated rhomboid family serine protease
MIPLSDLGIQRRTLPYVTGILLVPSVLVFVYQLTLNDLESFIFTYRYGAVPAELLGKPLPYDAYVVIGQQVQQIDFSSPIPAWATMFTSMFMHVGFLHLGGNMLYLWTFGKSI